MEEGARPAKPMIDPRALHAAAQEGARDRARREESARPPKHPPKARPVDQYGQPVGLYRVFFSWTTYAYLFSVWLVVAGALLIGRHPVVAALVLGWAALNFIGLLTSSWRRHRASRGVRALGRVSPETDARRNWSTDSRW